MMLNSYNNVKRLFKTVVLSSAPKQNYFLITSQGHCATGWLASTLNFHEKISCSHGHENPIHSMSFYYTERSNGIRTDWFKKILDDPNLLKFGVGPLAKDLLEKHANDRNLNLPCLRHRDFSDFQNFVFEELALLTDSAFIGNVHGVTLTNHKEIKQRSKKYGVGRFPVVDLIGDPVQRQEAALNIAERRYNCEDAYKLEVDACIDRNAKLVTKLEKDFEIDLSTPRLRCQFYWIYEKDIQAWWANEVANYPNERVAISDLIKNPDLLKKLISFITRKRLQPDNDFLDAVYDDKHILSGRRHGTKKMRTVEQVFHDWSDWQRYEYTKAHKRLDMKNVYKGFDFFVPDGY